MNYTAAHYLSAHGVCRNPECRLCASDADMRDRLRAAHAAGEHREFTREHCPTCVVERGLAPMSTASGTTPGSGAAGPAA